ncbi:MAG TPA: hypothetical protein VK622_10660, partial [Puia sp.]|nr:hypothetical protein [Puia sp.]
VFGRRDPVLIPGWIDFIWLLMSGNRFIQVARLHSGCFKIRNGKNNFVDRVGYYLVLRSFL